MPDILDLLPKDSFLREWPSCWPDFEGPTSYLIYTAISALGACLGRNVWYEFGDLNILPVLPTLLLGPPGLGKSRAIEYARNLVNSLPRLERPAEAPASTKEHLLWFLRNTPHATMYASELAAFFSTETYKDNLVPCVTRLLDFPPDHVEATKKDGTVYISKPTLNIMGGSTVSWFQERLPKGANAGGFLPRFLIVNENEPRINIAYPGRRTEAQKNLLERKRQELFSRFGSCARMYGELKTDPWGAVDAFTFWEQRYKPPEAVRDTFATRKKEFVHRLAINLAISRDSMVIDDVTMEAATKLYAYSLDTLAEVIVPYTPVGKAQAAVLKLCMKDGATEKEICRALKNSYSSQEIRKYIESLGCSGSLEFRDGRFITVN